MVAAPYRDSDQGTHGPCDQIEPAPVRNYDIVAEYPHDPNALTQGLIYAGGFLYESTGRVSLRRLFHEQ